MFNPRSSHTKDSKIVLDASLLKVKVKLVTIVKGNSKAPFSIATTLRCRGGRYSFP